ncbi:MAG: hypothetical protein A3E25_20910 [Burkholderiales bacterium RIFCSPHIGHO2_12_FULL_69_20]|nr:MAG: hypothetical protein A3E25_20910 [Burkholderiales bacterium RIFCSPHIGHO2_12_FULL_69_20]
MESTSISNSASIGAILLAAKLCEWRGQWPEAARLASVALEQDDRILEAYQQRALARRLLGDLDGAIEDYDRSIQIDPLCDWAWEFRGACRSTLAGRLPRDQMLDLQAKAELDYRQAAKLDPANERATLSMIEAAICADRYRAAFGYAGEAWSAIRCPRLRVVAAWLGCIAGILAERPPRTWDRYLQALRARQSSLGPLTWCVAEINSALRRLEAEGRHDCGTLARLTEVHDLFLSHFGEGGPALR